MAVGEDELISLKQIKSFSDKIISECEEGKNPDPKINYLIDEPCPTMTLFSASLIMYFLG